MIVARKRFGQHFLHDQSILQRIVDAVAPAPGDRLVEIGPGRGALTTRLLERHPKLDAIEIDRDLAASLQRQLQARAGFTLYQADALSFDFRDLAHARGSPLRVVGNLPYNISTPLLFHLLEQRDVIVDCHVMLQKEVIERMAATPGSKHYGRLTVMLAPWTTVTRLFDVGPDAFTPPPRVWSAVARVEFLREPRFAVPSAYPSIVAAAFSQRRKTLRNSLRRWLSPAAIAACGVDPAARAETLAPAQFATLAASASGTPIDGNSLN